MNYSYLRCFKARFFKNILHMCTNLPRDSYLDALWINSFAELSVMNSDIHSLYRKWSSTPKASSDNSLKGGGSEAQSTSVAINFNIVECALNYKIKIVSTSTFRCYGLVTCFLLLAVRVTSVKYPSSNAWRNVNLSLGLYWSSVTRLHFKKQNELHVKSTSSFGSNWSDYNIRTTRALSLDKNKTPTTPTTTLIFIEGMIHLTYLLLQVYEKW